MMQIAGELRRGIVMTASLIDKVINDTYRIERVIGTGGMGSVFEASHTRIPKRFAVKLLTRKMIRNRQALQRFYREARITSELGHENIVQVVDFNNTDLGEPFIVMELLDGEDLAHRIYRVTRLDLEETSDILQQVASAMEVAHLKGIVHRDLKPQNLFLCPREGKDDLVKVLDFGISKIVGSESLVSSTRTLMGSLYFIAPEQTRSSEVDHYADIYSMGCIVYTMLAGRPPFYSEDGEDMVEQILTADPPSLREHNDNVPQQVEAVVLKALQKLPEDRYNSMVAFADAFEMAVLRSRSVDFERTDLVEPRELFEDEEEEEEEGEGEQDEEEFGKQVLAGMSTELLTGKRKDTVELSEDELEEDSDTITPETGSEGTGEVLLSEEDMEEDPEEGNAGATEEGAALSDRDLDEAETPRPRPRRLFAKTIHDPKTLLKWPPRAGDEDEKPTDEWQSVSAALEIQRLEAERRETSKVDRVDPGKLGAPDTTKTPAVGERDDRETEEVAPTDGPRGPLTGPFRIMEEGDDGELRSLQRGKEKIPTDELVPTRVVWKGEVDDSDISDVIPTRPRAGAPLRKAKPRPTADQSSPGEPAPEGSRVATPLTDVTQPPGVNPPDDDSEETPRAKEFTSEEGIVMDRVDDVDESAESALFHRQWLSDVTTFPGLDLPWRKILVVLGMLAGIGMIILLVMFANSEEEPLRTATYEVDGQVPRSTGVPVKVVVLGTDGGGAKQPARSGNGVLVVVTTNGQGESIWADVYLDGDRVGSTPLRRQVSAGTHNVSVRKRSFRTISTRTVVRKDETKRVHLVLEEIP